MNASLSSQRARTLIALALTLLLLAAACGGDDDAASTTTMLSTTTLATTTTAASTTTTPPATAAPTTTAATTTTAVPTTTIDTDALAEGSGCTPGTDELADGEWFGYVDAVAAETLEFDLACWFSGDAAVLASAEDGEESPPPNDYYIRNVNPQLRSVTIAADAEVAWLPNVGDPTSEETVVYASWVAGRELRGVELQPGVWLTIEDGEVTGIREQYVP